MSDPRERREKRPKGPTHPKLTRKEDAEQRGEDPTEGVGPPVVPDFPDEDPNWVPDPAVADPWRDLIHQHGREHRPNREDVLPYLLIRAYAPGDRAKRPIWPPIPSWLSPDILLVDAAWTGPFRPDKVVGSSVAGRTYRVFVHTWNLGLLAAGGVHVRAWYVDPGFFGGAPGIVPTFIGGAFTDLAPRTAQGAHQVVEVQPPWSIPPSLTGHECLLASVDCPADRWNGIWDANADRHVGQRNITILAGNAPLAPLLMTLGGALELSSFLELTLTAAEGREPLKHGVPIKGGRHLFVTTKLGEADREGRLLIMPTTRLVEALGESAPALSEAGTASRLFARFLRRVGGVEFQHESLDAALGALLDVPALTAELVAQAMGGVDVSLHLSAFGPEVQPTGGYTIGIAAKAE